MCVLSIRQQDLITSWQRNSLQKQLGCFLKIHKKKPTPQLIYILRRAWAIFALESLASMSNFLHLPISDLSPQYKELAFLSPWPCSSVGVLKGSFYLLLNPAENFPFWKTWPSPSGWLCFPPPTAASPFHWCLLHFLGTHTPLHAHGGAGKAAPSPGGWKRHSEPQNWWEHLTVTTQTLWGVRSRCSKTS